MMKGNKMRSEKLLKTRKSGKKDLEEALERKRQERLEKKGKKKKKKVLRPNTGSVQDDSDVIHLPAMSTEEGVPVLASLPMEAWLHIFSFLGSSYALRRASMVCTVWRELAMDTLLWMDLSLPHPTIFPRLKLIEMDKVVAHGRWTNTLSWVALQDKLDRRNQNWKSSFNGGVLSAGGDGKVIIWQIEEMKKVLKARDRDRTNGKQTDEEDAEEEKDIIGEEPIDRGIKGLLSVKCIETGFTSIRCCALIDNLLYAAVREDLYVYDPFQVLRTKQAEDGDKEGEKDVQKKEEESDGSGEKKEVNIEKPIRKLSCHVNTVTCLVECFGCICSGAYDGTVVLWSKGGAGEKVKILRFGRNRILTMRPWKGMLAVGDTGKEEITLWDDCYQRHSLKTPNLGSILCFQEWNGLLWTGSDSMDIRGWSWDEGKKKGDCLFNFKGHQGSVRVLEVWNGFLLSGSQDGTIKAWDDSGRSIDLCNEEEMESNQSLSHSANSGGTPGSGGSPLLGGGAGVGGGGKKGRKKQPRKKKKGRKDMPSWYTLLPIGDSMLLGGVLTADHQPGTVNVHEVPTMYLWHRVLLANPRGGFVNGEEEEDDEEKEKEDKLWRELLICD